MLMARHGLAIDLGRRRLRALQGTLDGASLRIRHALVSAVPANLSADDPVAVGRWIADELRSAGIGSAPATIALPREDVVLKRLLLPTIERDELPEMTRLALLRELPFGGDGAVIDLLPLHRDASSTSVMAVAVSARRLEFIRRAAESAGLSVQRVALRCTGAAALADNADSAPESAGCLAIDLTGEGAEFTVSRSRTMRFSRAAEVAESDDPRALAEAVVTEARRTWMSYRMAEDAEPVHRAVLLGDAELCAEVAVALGGVLQVPVEVMREHPRVRSDAAAWSAAWPLAGLLLEPALGGEMIDLLKPRKAPDLAARRRQRALAVAGLGLVACLASWTLGRQDFKRLERRAQTLKAEVNEAGPRAWRSFRDEDRLAHLRQWSNLETDWLEQFARVHALLPPATEVVLDAWASSVSAETVAWDKVTRAWSAEKELRITLEGEAHTRAAADALRDVLVKDEAYLTTSTGAESAGGKRLSDPFAFELRSRVVPAGVSTAAPPPRKESGS